jgi:hypothetical protein
VKKGSLLCGSFYADEWTIRNSARSLPSLSFQGMNEEKQEPRKNVNSLADCSNAQEEDKESRKQGRVRFLYFLSSCLPYFVI